MARWMALAGLALCVGCHAPTPSWNMFGQLRPARVPPPGTKSYNAGQAPYYQRNNQSISANTPSSSRLADNRVAQADTSRNVSGGQGRQNETSNSSFQGNTGNSGNQSTQRDRVRTVGFDPSSDPNANNGGRVDEDRLPAIDLTRNDSKPSNSRWAPTRSDAVTGSSTDSNPRTDSNARTVGNTRSSEPDEFRPADGIRRIPQTRTQTHGYVIAPEAKNAVGGGNTQNQGKVRQASFTQWRKRER